MADEKKCMACECPCDEHKEHDHAAEGKKCENCGHGHGDVKSCADCKECKC